MLSKRILVTIFVLISSLLYNKADGITNGETVKDNTRYPFMSVVATSGGSLLCSSVLISRSGEKKWFLTSGRCFTQVASNELLQGTLVAAGNTNISKMHAYTISKVFVHPYFNRFNYANDIALFRVDKLNLEIEPISLPDPSTDLSEIKHFSTLGWGGTGTASVSQVLARGNVTGVTDSTILLKVLSGKSEVHKTISGTGSVLRDYDYGAPLIGGVENLDDDTNDTLIGIGSWYKSGGSVSLYTDVRQYIDWINSVISSDEKGVNLCSAPCSDMKKLVNSEDGSECVLSSGESECTFTHCKFYCPFDELDNGKCDNDCDQITCSHDKNSCSYSLNEYIVDPSFEYSSTYWEYYYQYSSPIKTEERCLDLNINNFNCTPPDGSSMMFSYGFPISSYTRNDVYTYSYISQRMQFPTGASYLSFYFQASCDTMNAKEYFDITIDYTLLLRITAAECPKYSTTHTANWTWMALPIPAKFADGKEHTLIFDFYLGASDPFTVFALDVLRFVVSEGSFDDGVGAGPCADGTHPIAATEGAVAAGAATDFCGWQSITCCNGTGLSEKVSQAIGEREGSPCMMTSACVKMLRTLSCIDCAPIEYSHVNAGSGKHKICKEYSKHVYAACKESDLSVNGVSCVRMGSMFENEEEFANYFAEYSASNDDCFTMNYSGILSEDEVGYIKNNLKKCSGGLSTGGLAAIIVVCVVVVAAVFVAVFIWLVVYRPKHHASGNDTDRMYGGGKKGTGKKKKNNDKGTMKNEKGSKKDEKGSMKKEKESMKKEKESMKKEKESMKSTKKSSKENGIELETTKTNETEGKSTGKKKKKKNNKDYDNFDEEEEKEVDDSVAVKKDEGEEKKSKKKEKGVDTKKGGKGKKGKKGSSAPVDTYEEEISY